MYVKHVKLFGTYMGKTRVSPRKFIMFNISPAQKQILKLEAKEFNIPAVRIKFRKKRITETREMLNFVRHIRQTQIGKPKKFNIPQVSVMFNGE